MHLAIIMDGNGRWARKKNLPRPAGHLEGLKACKRIVKAASELKLDYLTLYVFSTENKKRPIQEVNYLMKLIANKLPDELNFFNEYNIKILFKGDIKSLPVESYKGIEKTMNSTKQNTGLNVVLAINYGGQDEIVRAVNRFLSNNLVNVKETGKLSITALDINDNLDSPNVPPPDLIIRTAGEMRLSNFLLWESAYSELYFSEKLWPDWDKTDLIECLDVFSKRTRKFGNIE